MYILKLDHTFSAAHQLTNAYDDKCNDSIHGHNWKVKVSIEVKELNNGMVIDFTNIKEIIDTLDHKNLNEILDFEPTAENLARYIHNKISAINWNKRNPRIKVEIFEAEKSSIIYLE